MGQPAAVNVLAPHFRFPLKGEQVAGRFLIGCALLFASFFVPILPSLFVFGYLVQVMRRATAGETPAMHAWQDWGGLLKDGFRAWVISLVFFLPGLIVLLVGLGTYFASFLSFSMVSETESSAAVLLPFFLGMASLFLGMSVGFLLVLLASIPLPAALAHFAAEDSFAAAFHFRQWWNVIRSNALGFLIAWVVVGGLIWMTYVVGMMAYYTIILACLFPLLSIPASFYGLLVGASLFGDLYAEGKAKVGQPGA